eukprot:TRINITY_DN17676_c0_g1_i1.p1 TRINITY_DN17676_c0_g1~~TRINITY_DN17676_c0_g1_i1.p1  ORF type:complete len:370 (+),score=78.81 TRINITY_DN17676_c0_g1_i1:122-1231(+)
MGCQNGKALAAKPASTQGSSKEQPKYTALPQKDPKPVAKLPEKDPEPAISAPIEVTAKENHAVEDLQSAAAGIQNKIEEALSKAVGEIVAEAPLQQGSPSVEKPDSIPVATMDLSIRDALLSDPKVKEAFEKAGVAALSNPDVQQAILDQCAERFPKASAAAREQIQQWASDPDVKAKAEELRLVAMKYAATAASYAGAAAAEAGDQLLGVIEQGPAGVRLMAFAGGVASLVLACTALVDPRSALANVIGYTISLYQTLFSLTAMLFEAKAEWIQAISGLSSYQSSLLENAKFLSTAGGRGLFYAFQGTLWLAFASMTELFEVGCGLFLCFVGLLHILMHFGVMPEEVARVIKGGYKDYQLLPTSEPTA